ncbi:uncharacterized protein F4822DRAFT_16005 [Hypoxylon trugodes]|uniref:uncharacterized protein n=1 Tax=Hypoxylon trugodes TaxID=326681 RepID=UPI002195417A|nr:uncharacterized protein F4822DRAFT_16005 [Hypoxylon trugodes]KAI1393537.1 hypothetical protein F4822DRAFT_16005 [Hypoxylon trugodes]
MLIRTYDQFLRASSRQLEHSMAPYSVTFDYRGQIIDNCEFFVAKYDIVSVITVKDAVGEFKAYAIRANEDSRDVLLASDSWHTPLKAIESLHTKSCEAVHHYITSNGFSYPPDLKKAKIDEDDDEKDEEDDEDVEDEDVASIVSGHSATSTACWGSSDDEAGITPASSADPHLGCRETTAGNEKGNNISKRRSKPPPSHIVSCSSAAGAVNRQSWGPSSSRFPPIDQDDDSDDEIPTHIRSLPQQQFPRVKFTIPMGGPPPSGSTPSYRPPAPPASWNGPPGPPPPAAVMCSLPIPAGQSQPQPQAGPPGPTPHPMTFATNHIAPSSTPTATSTTTTTTNPTPNPLISLRTSPGSTRPYPPLNYKASAPNLGSNQLTPPPPPHLRLYDVRLTIRWLGHGEQRILESCRASIRVLQEMAVSYVRTHTAAFEHPGGKEPFPHRAGWGLRAIVRMPGASRGLRLRLIVWHRRDRDRDSVRCCVTRRCAEMPFLWVTMRFMAETTGLT